MRGQNFDGKLHPNSATSETVSCTNYDMHEMWKPLFQLNKKYYVQYDDEYVTIKDISHPGLQTGR